MRPFWALLKRELFSLWVTPLAWVLLSTFLLIQGGIFCSILIHYVRDGDANHFGPLSAYFGQQSVLMPISLLMLCPPLTMRSMAEERRSQSIELLICSPATELHVIAAKFLGTWFTYLLVWLPTVLYVFILRTIAPLDLGALFTSYLGLALIGASFIALGILCSALTRSQLTALLLTVFLQFSLFLVGLGEYLLDDGLLRDLSAHLSITGFLEEASRGLIDSRRVILHVSIASWALYIATQLMRSWRRA